MIKSRWITLLLFASLGITSYLVAPILSEDQSAAAAAQAEKEKALKNPYPNDLGPSKIEGIAKYTPEQQEGYKLMQDKCSRCHTPSRPLNSQFLDVKPEEMAKLK